MGGAAPGEGVHGPGETRRFPGAWRRSPRRRRCWCRTCGTQSPVLICLASAPRPALHRVSFPSPLPASSQPPPASNRTAVAGGERRQRSAAGLDAGGTAVPAEASMAAVHARDARASHTRTVASCGAQRGWVG
jgi:hypothetical protein